MTQPSPGPALARAPLVLAIYAVTAAILAASWWRGLVPFPFLDGDAGNIASFAAGWSHPGAWTGDMVLANHDNFRFYATIHIPLLIALAPLTGDLGTAFVVLLAPLMWIQALGHWLLGRLLFRHADGAFLLGLLSFGSVSMTLDYYGTYPDAQPRFLFQAALPFLLAGLVKAAESPGRWPRLMGLHGLAVYLHPVSAPSVALASWLTLLLRGPRGRPVMAGLAFVLPALPFAAMYLSGHEHGPTADYAAALARQSLLFGPEFTDGWAYLRRVLTTWQMRWFVPVWGQPAGRYS